MPFLILKLNILGKFKPIGGLIIMLKIRNCRKFMKVCKVCGEIKLISDFRKDNRAKDGYRNQCKVCKNKKRRIRYKNQCKTCRNKKSRIEYKHKNVKLYLNKIECKKFMKVCSNCKKLKLISNFSKKSNGKDGYMNQCKACTYNKAKSRHSLVCLECGKEFTSRNKKQKFCSTECRDKNQCNKKEVLCDYCGKPIKLPEYRIEKSDHHFCSNKCKGKWKTNNNTEEVLCDCCGKLIKVQKREIKNYNHHFCNDECYRKWNIGENNPSWNPNLTDEDRQERRYIERYNNFIKQVLERDNYTCQLTGKRGGDLEVHHLNCFSDFKEGRTDMNNCITLSKEIHRLFHKIYGNRHNIKEQFEEFKHRYHNGEFKEVI